MNHFRVSLITSFCIISFAALPYPIIFQTGLTLPGTTDWITVDSETAQALQELYTNQSGIAFVHALEGANPWWGAVGTLINAKQPKKTEPPIAYEVQYKEVIALYNPQTNIKYIQGRPYVFNQIERQSHAEALNRMSAETGEHLYQQIAPRYRTHELRKELHVASHHCNKLIAVLCQRLDLKVPEEIASQLLEYNRSSHEKLSRIWSLAREQGKLAKKSAPESGNEIERYRTQLEDLALPDHIAAPIAEAIDRFEKAQASPHEGPALDAYIKFTLDLPWTESLNAGRESFDLEMVAKSLDDYQYGMDEVKERIIDYLALRSVSPSNMPFIICLVGKPGVGKTSICQGIAKALNRPFARIPLGGINTEGDIAGVSRVFVGATPGKIMNAFRSTKTAAPVILLDEIDKLANGNERHGSPADALLQVLDPEQNSQFLDNYVTVPFNASKALYIATANNMRKIPPALLDRMEIIQIPSYSLDEKVFIAQTKIIPKLIERAGFIDKKPHFSDELLTKVINDYTFEAGLRGLQTRLITLISKYARGYLRGEEVIFTTDNLTTYLGAAHGALDAFKGRAKQIEPSLSDEAREKLFNAIEKFDETDEQTPLYEYLKDYISFFLSLPWHSEAQSINADLAAIRTELDARHYGMQEVKEKILDHIALQQHSQKKAGAIILLAGPAGVGKTTIAESIAHALGKPFARIACGSLTNESDVRGLSKEYTRPKPGAILKALSSAQSKEALVLLDELDKIPYINIANALLDVLDPKQNSTFTDGYLDVPFDLSNVMFVATANHLNDIPYPLLNRMNIIMVDAYTLRQKINIAENYVIPHLLEETGLLQKPTFLTTPFITNIILGYTHEAGVRNLTQNLQALLARYARNLSEARSFTGTKEELIDLFGEPISQDPEYTGDSIGIVNGLYVSPAGGGLLKIQVTLMPGNGKFIATGSLAEVMKESTQAALSYVKAHSSKWNIDPGLLKNNDIHLHVPDGAQPKDGPSAGLAFCVALVSALTQRPVDHRCAMTGEIDIRGNALIIGGLDQKLEGARRNGMTTVFVPEQNRKSIEALRELPEGVEIVFVQHVDEILDQVLLANQNNLIAATA